MSAAPSTPLPAALAGLLSHVGLLDEREEPRPARGGRPAPKRRRPAREYLGARNARFAVFPGSVLKGRNPDFLMSAELVETSRLWARQNAAIKPEWAERLGAHLVKRTYSEPHWSRKRAAVMARERVTLYGVPLVADRLVQYGRIDAPLARATDSWALDTVSEEARTEARAAAELLSDGVKRRSTLPLHLDAPPVDAAFRNVAP